MNDTPPAVNRPRPLAWVLGAVIAALLAAFLAAHLPDRAKLLGLFPLFWAVAVGSGLRWWGTECHLAAPRWMLFASFLILSAGEATIVLEGWRVYRHDLGRQFAKDPSAGFMNQARKPAAATPETEEEKQLRAQLQAEIERVRRVRQSAVSLESYLQRRLKAISRLSPPWPAVCWSAEILLGGLLGTWIVSRRTAPRNSDISASLPGEAGAESMPPQSARMRPDIGPPGTEDL